MSDGLNARRAGAAPALPRLRPALDALRRAAQARPQAIAAVAFAALLVLYNNVAYAREGWAFPPAWLLYPRAVLLPALAVAAALFVAKLAPADLGLARERLTRGAATGLALAVAAALPVALVLAVCAAAGIDAFAFDNVNGVSGAGALYWALLLYPLHTVVFEEVLFRGVLQGLAVRAFRAGPGIALTAAAFALWHVVLDYQVLGEATVSGQPALFVLFQLVVLAAIFAGGLLLGWLRERTGSLLAPVAFHYGFLTLLAGTVFLSAQ